MQRSSLLLLAAFVGTVGVACDTGGQAMDEDPASQPAQQDTGMAMDTAGAATEGGAQLRTDSLQDGAVYLTDASGRALYLLEGEPADSSTCYDACAEEWPPLLAAEGSPTAGSEELEEELLGTIQRQGGETQVTYGGHPLYYYHDDTGSGQTQGQDVTDAWGEWYLVTPTGDPVEGHDEESGAADG